MEIFVQYIDDTKLDHYYTQVSRRSDRKSYSLPDNQPLQDLLPGLINFSRAPHKITDACLELKSSDYHRYLDMEYTLKEHIQDFGVSITPQDTIVIKTKLSLLVSALKDKMDQCSYGGDTRTLRTILKHIPGIIDEDTDFAPELLKQKGLAFLRSLPERDNYSNFDRKKVTTIVLNVLFKIVSYVDGLMSVFRDRSTVSWLYSQVKGCSNGRNPEGRNITIAILYIFVDSDLDTDAVPSLGPHDLAVLFIKCAQEVHQREKSPLFSTFIDILSDKILSDPETVLAVIRLINKILETLKEADEMDLFDDLVLALLEQDLSKVIEKHKQGKTARNKIVQEYNNFSKLLCQEYEDTDTGDLDSILKQCMHRRPSYQPGSLHSGSEDNLSLISRDRVKRNSLTNNCLSPNFSDRRDLTFPRSMTPDIRLSSPTPSKSPGEISGRDTQNLKDSKRNPLSNGVGMTSTPKPAAELTNEISFDKKNFKKDYLYPKDSYTPGTYRSIHSPAGGDSGYHSGSSLSRSESTEKIISPHDRGRKEYYEGSPRTIAITESVTNDKDTPTRSYSRKSPYSLKNSDKSDFSFNTPHIPLTATKSHPYSRENLPSPAGPPRKLDSPYSSFTRPSPQQNSYSSHLTDRTSQKEYDTKIDTKPKIMNSQSGWRMKEANTANKQVNSLDSKWINKENKFENKFENKITKLDSKPKEPKSFQDRQTRKQRLDASQIISAVQSSQNKETHRTDTSQEETAPSKICDTQETSSPYSIYTVHRANLNKPKPNSLTSGYVQSVNQEAVREKKEITQVDTSKNLKQRFKELALSSETAVSIDEKETPTTAVKMPVLEISSFEKETPILNISKLQKQESEPKRSEVPVLRVFPPVPSQAERLGFVEFGCDLAPVCNTSDIYITPFSPDLKWSPDNYITTQPRAIQPNIQDKSGVTAKKVPEPSQDTTMVPSPVSSPTEENPFAKHLAERKRSSVSKQAPLMLPLPEINLAKHELSFGPFQFLDLDNRYDKDPYESEVKAKVRHIPGTIPTPPPDIPRVNRIPDPPPNIPEVQTGSEVENKGKRKMNFRWNLVGKEESEKKRNFWKFDKILEIPPEIINSFIFQPSNAREDRKSSKTNKPIERIEVLPMKRRTSLGVSLKRLQKFEMREDDNNFRNLRKILTGLDLEVINEQIIEVLEKDVLISSFDNELKNIIRAKQDALSLGQSVTLPEEEKFILALGEVERLKERINIATFCLRFYEKEEEIAKKLLILMGAAKEIRTSPTFKDVLNTLLMIGNAVEHKEAGGFDLEFLQRAEAYKDAYQKKDLINHAASCVIEKYPNSTNLFSDFHNVHDALRMELDFVQLKLQISQEQENWSVCTSNVPQLKLTNSKSLTQKLEQFGQKINKFYITLGRMENYYRDLYLYFGYDKYLADSQKLLDFLRVLHNFSLAYKTNHERIIQIREKMALEKRREKTRGKKLPIAENIQVKIVDRADQDGTKSESGPEDDGSGYSRGVMNAVLEHCKEKKKPRTGVKYRQAKQNGNRREKRNSIRRTLNEEDGLIELAKKELAESPTS
ncbi:FH1/FH2 domain-containing protein 3 [Oopsacas minuta]|uniref:FH1/FH2 domain-containing protein 3 n=1 Tax=Oopsacas minuta TaxID=111878 RepID=A0AAV7JNZ6_9METZ|nr:FH1/FH2 domain-containing protein 3 [Oopsacas minuta]